MAESRVISLRVPQNLLNCIDKLAADRYPSRRPDQEPNRSQLILDALENYAYSVNNVSDIIEDHIKVFVDSVNKRMTEAVEQQRQRLPDLEAIRDRILSSHKSALDRRLVRLNLDKFIEELRTHEQQINR